MGSVDSYLKKKDKTVRMVESCSSKKYNEKYKENKHINSSAIEVMQQYDWPGNVRELGNIIERLIIVIDEPNIGSEHIIKMVDNKKLSAVCFNKSNLSLKEAVQESKDR